MIILITRRTKVLKKYIDNDYYHNNNTLETNYFVVMINIHRNKETKKYLKI